MSITRLSRISPLSNAIRPALHVAHVFTSTDKCRSCKVSSRAATQVQKDSDFPKNVTGQSGRICNIVEILQDKPYALGRVYLASDGANPFIVKEIEQDYGIRTSIYKRAGVRRHVRSLIDTVPARRIFIFEYLNENLLQLAQKDLPTHVMKCILKSALAGLVALHEQDIVHNDVKANNIMVQIDSLVSGVKVEKVELVDLEDAAHVPQGTVLEGVQLGNIMWRSPEAHAIGPMSKPSDIFSFGIVCIYAMTQILPFAVDRSELPEGIEMLAVVLERQIIYFADKQGFYGLLEYLGSESEWLQIFRVIAAEFNEARPRTPFAHWAKLDLDQEDLFRDLILGLTNFDPSKRLTAREALRHPWFEGVNVA